MILNSLPIILNNYVHLLEQNILKNKLWLVISCRSIALIVEIILKVYSLLFKVTLDAAKFGRREEAFDKIKKTLFYGSALLWTVPKDWIHWLPAYTLRFSEIIDKILTCYSWILRKNLSVYNQNWSSFGTFTIHSSEQCVV